MTSRHSTAAPIERENERSRILAADGPAPATGCFQPLDRSIVNDAIPAFFVGRNKQGFWVARDVRGRVGGIFLFRNSALSFARKYNRPGCATIFPSERFELDLENNGNRVIPYLESLLRATMRPRRRMTTLASNMLVTIKCRLNDFQVF
jgi:hypothetical protein